jgi:uncharacterized protein
MLSNINDIKQQICSTLATYGVRKAGLFGSFARGNPKSQSDIDLLIELDSKKNLLDFIELKLVLEDILGLKVDLVEYDCIKPAIRAQILADEIRLI